MTDPTIIGLRSIELGVPDADKSAKFYTEAWGLEEVISSAEGMYFRGTGPEHHLLALRRHPNAALLRVHLAASDAQSVDRLHAKAKARGASIESVPAPLTAEAGGGYGFHLSTPQGLPLGISSQVAGHPNILSDSSRPARLGHVVLNSTGVEAETQFFRDVLGFRLSDSTAQMDFLRCGANHHTVAIARGKKPALNHMAYELDNIDGLMRGCGRLARHGFRVEWGIGRHGPGDNVFAYFIDPNGFAAEYTTEMQQVDEATYMPNNAAYWSGFPMRPCRWGLANEVSDRIKQAFSGALAESGQK